MSDSVGVEEGAEVVLFERERPAESAKMGVAVGVGMGVGLVRCGRTESGNTKWKSGKLSGRLAGSLGGGTDWKATRTRERTCERRDGETTVH